MYAPLKKTSAHVCETESRIILRGVDHRDVYLIASQKIWKKSKNFFAQLFNTYDDILPLGVRKLYMLRELYKSIIMIAKN